MRPANKYAATLFFITVTSSLMAQEQQSPLPELSTDIPKDAVIRMVKSIVKPEFLPPMFYASPQSRPPWSCTKIKSSGQLLPANMLT